MEKADKQKTTIYDIAYRAGVSQSTVSRVLNGASQVSEAKRAAVLAAIESLRYRPNLFAQRLASGSSRTIGILAADTESPFFAQVIRGIQETVARAGYVPLVVSVQGMGNVEDAVALLLRTYVGGVCVVGQPLTPDLTERLQQEVPVFGVCPDTPGLQAQCPRVDNEGGGHRATQHLVALGHKRIAHVAGPAGHDHAVARRRGYAQCLLDSGLSVDPALVVHGDFCEASGKRACDELLARRVPFSAIFAGNDAMAFGAQLSLYRHGLYVPHHVSLVGFDDTPQAQFRTPPLTTVVQPASQMGAAVARQVLAALTDDAEPQTEMFATPLVIRESTAAPAGSRSPLT